MVTLGLGSSEIGSNTLPSPILQSHGISFPRSPNKLAAFSYKPRDPAMNLQRLSDSHNSMFNTHGQA